MQSWTELSVAISNQDFPIPPMLRLLHLMPDKVSTMCYMYTIAEPDKVQSPVFRLFHGKLSMLTLTTSLYFS